MSIFEIKEQFLVEENVGMSFDEVVGQASREVAELVTGKDVIILPSHGTSDAFYSGSLDILDYLKYHNINAEILASDEQYKELSLHGAEVWLGTFLIQNFVIPLFCSVVANYIYDSLKAKPSDKISLKFIVEKKNGGTASVSFDGKVEDLSKAIDAVKEFCDES